MNKIDPIIAVKDVNASADWYQSVMGWNRTHGGDEFAVLKDDQDAVMLCLHQWGAHEHPTMQNPAIKPGNGLILYFKTDQLEVILNRVEALGVPMAEALHQNPNSRKREFSLRDPDGYFLSITEYHNYEG